MKSVNNINAAVNNNQKEAIFRNIVKHLAAGHFDMAHDAAMVLGRTFGGAPIDILAKAQAEVDKLALGGRITKAFRAMEHVSDPQHDAVQAKALKDAIAHPEKSQYKTVLIKKAVKVGTQRHTGARKAAYVEQPLPYVEHEGYEPTITLFEALNDDSKAVMTTQLKAFVDGGCVVMTAHCDDADVQSAFYGAMHDYNFRKEAKPAEQVMSAIHKAIAVRLVSEEILAEAKSYNAIREMANEAVRKAAAKRAAERKLQNAMDEFHGLEAIAVNPVMAPACDENVDIDALRAEYTEAVAGDNVSSNLRVENVESVKDLSMKDLPEALQAPLSTKAAHEYVKHMLKAMINTTSVRYQMVKLCDGNEYYNEDVRGEMKLTTFGINKLTARYMQEARTRSVWAYDNGMVRLFGNAIEKQPVTDEMLMIDASELDSNIDEDIARSVRENGVSIKFVPSEKAAYFCFRTRIKRSDGTDSDLEERTVIKIGANGCMYTFGVTQNDEFKAFMKELMAKDGEVRTYRFFYAGPSNQRQKNFILFLQHKGEDKEAFEKRIRDDFNYLTGGLLTALEEKVTASKDGVPREKLFKLVSRISLAFTPQTPLFSMKSFAFYNGVLGSGKGDGQWLFDGSLLAAQTGLPIEGILGLGYQARMTTGVINKGMGIAISHVSMATVAASYGKAVHLSHKKFRQLWIEGKLKDNTMYFVGGKCPGAIFDSNSMKAVCDTPEDGEFWINLMSVKSHTQGKLNIQNAESIAAIDGAPEFIYDEGKKYIDKKLAEIDRVLNGNLKGEIEYTEEELADAKAKGIVLPLTLSVVNPLQYYPQLVGEVAPFQVAHDKKLYQMFVEDIAKGLTKDISKFNFEIDGMEYRTLQSDYAGMLLGKEASLLVLRENEVFMPGIKEGTIVTLTRCPKADKYEFYQAKVVGLKTILKRLNALKKSGKFSLALIGVVERMFRNADTGLVITPDDPKVVNSLGGSDFDADGALCDMNKMSNAIFRIIGDGSSTIPDDDGEDAKINITSFNIDTVQDMMYAGIYGQENAQGRRVRPVGIGIIANHATLISALLHSSDDVLQQVLDEVIIPAVKALGIESDGHVYQRHAVFTPNDVKVYDKDVLELNRDFYTSDLSLESFKNALADADRCGSSVEGRGIDVNKNGKTVHAGYLAVLEKKDGNFDPIKMRGGKRCKAYDTIKFEAVFTDEGGENNEPVVHKMDYKKPGYGKDNVIYVKSPISGVREQLMEYLVSKINEYFAKPIEAGTIETSLVKNTKYAASASKKVNMRDLKNMKAIHNYAMNAELSSAEKRVIRSYLANTVRWIFAPGTRAFEKFLQIKSAAMVQNDNASADYTSFEFVLHEEYVQGVLYIAKNEHWKTNQLLGFKAYVLDDSKIADGEKVHFTNGMTSDGSHIVTDKHASGEWTMRKLGNNWYATHTAAEEFAAPDVDDKIVMNTAFGFKVSVADVANSNGTMTLDANGFKTVAHLNGSDKSWDIFADKDGKFHELARSNGSIKVTQVMQIADKKGDVTIVCGHRVAGMNGGKSQAATKANAKTVANLKAGAKKVTIKVAHFSK